MPVWGGESSERAFDDGAAYEPSVDHWRPVPRAPMAERRGSAQIWTGEEMVVWGGAPGRGAGLQSGHAALTEPHGPGPRGGRHRHAS